jgi:hypothetical protein
MLDAGVFVSKNWFDVLVMLPIDGIYAGVTSASPHRPDHWLSLQLKTFYDQTGLLNPRINKRNHKLLYAPTCNLVIPSSIFTIRFLDRVFPDAGFEDVEYCIRLQKFYGKRIELIRNLNIFHTFRETSIDQFSSQFIRYGRNHSRFNRIYPGYDHEFNQSENFVVGGK